MYIWNVKKAAKCLKEGSITEKQKFQTLFLYIVIGFCAMLIGSFVKDPSQHNSTISSIYLLPTAIVVLVGIYICYRKNAKGDNTDFLGRFVILGLPLFLRILIFIIVASFLFGILSAMLADRFSIHLFTPIYMSIIISFSYLLLFLWIASYLEDISNNESQIN